MDTFLKDIRFGFRMLWKRPGFTIVTILTLALGIGANTAIFTVVNAALLRPFPYREPDRLVHIWESKPQQQFKQREASYQDYNDWKERNRVFEDLAGYQPGQSFTLTGRETPERIQAARVTSSFFDLLGVEAILGRTFLKDEDRPGGDRLAILSYGLWQRRFGADPQIVGQSLTLNGSSYTVAGILPAYFHFAPAGQAELWVPLNPNSEEVNRRFYHWINVIARLKPGISLEQSQTDMSGVAGQIEQEQKSTHTGVGIRIVSLSDQIVGNVRPILFVLLGAVGFVLLIACANVANLLLARATSRRKEIAIRLALGAGRLRVLRQLLTESVLLSLLGGAAGLFWAQWGIELLIAPIPNFQLASMPYLKGLSIDSGVLAFTAGLSLLTGIFFGLAPALQTLKLDLQDSLKEGGKTSSGSTRNSLRKLLVVSEVALALVLLVGAGLFLKSTLRLLQVDPGFNPNNLLTLQISLPATKYTEEAQLVAFHDQLLSKIGALPGVKGVAGTTKLPLIGGTSSKFIVEGRPAPAPGEEIEANTRDVTPEYFSVMGAPLLKGRYFTEKDNKTAPNYLIINKTLSDRLFPDEDPIGKRLLFSPTQKYEIVGVVGDMKEGSLDTLPTPTVYGAYLQDPGSTMTLVVRTGSDPNSFTGTVRKEVEEMDRDIPIFNVQSMDQLIANSPSTFSRKYPSFLIGAFALVALILSGIGIYGVISYSVTQRSHELGIRMALGASRLDILKLVLGQGMILILSGIGIGLVAALLLTRSMSSLLFNVSRTDPTTFLLVSILLTIVALIACFIPAQRATRVDPMVALRYE
jgi:predicted permease